MGLYEVNFIGSYFICKNRIILPLESATYLVLLQPKVYLGIIDLVVGQRSQGMNLQAFRG